MTAFEITRLGLEPVLPPLYQKVRTRLLSLAEAAASRPARILDVGGRKSPYTIGLPARVCLTDLPRRSPVQQDLHLGINDGIIRQIRRRRTNVAGILYDDMTQSSLRNSFFDCVVAVEVLEHVERDRDFVREVHRVLKAGGSFLLTTPNGDSVPNTNPDHKRHYTRQQLTEVLSAYFPKVQVEYAIPGGVFRRWGLKSWSVGHPADTLLSMVGNLVNARQAAGPAVRQHSQGTRHLIALAEKSFRAS